MSRRWNSSYRKPPRSGWYECRARDGRWQGEIRHRAWGRGRWWIPLSGGWLSSPMGLYQWRGPRIPMDKGDGCPMQEVKRKGLKR